MHGKNGFSDVTKTEICLKIILLDYENNYTGRSNAGNVKTFYSIAYHIYRT